MRTHEQLVGLIPQLHQLHSHRLPAVILTASIPMMIDPGTPRLSKIAIIANPMAANITGIELHHLNQLKLPDYQQPHQHFLIL